MGAVEVGQLFCEDVHGLALEVQRNGQDSCQVAESSSCSPFEEADVAEAVGAVGVLRRHKQLIIDRHELYSFLKYSNESGTVTADHRRR